MSLLWEEEGREHMFGTTSRRSTRLQGVEKPEYNEDEYCTQQTQEPKDKKRKSAISVELFEDSEEGAECLADE
eukprot:3544992-Prymnesium_polylepis.1